MSEAALRRALIEVQSDRSDAVRPGKSSHVTVSREFVIFPDNPYQKRNDWEAYQGWIAQVLSRHLLQEYGSNSNGDSRRFIPFIDSEAKRSLRVSTPPLSRVKEILVNTDRDACVLTMSISALLHRTPRRRENSFNPRAELISILDEFEASFSWRSVVSEVGGVNVTRHELDTPIAFRPPGTGSRYVAVVIAYFEWE